MPPWVVVGPGDDAAVIAPERGALDVLTTDALVEGVHFDRRSSRPTRSGHRALAVNLSDLAAMGARPRAALLSLVLPDALDVDGDRSASGRTAGACRASPRDAGRRQHHAHAGAAGRRRHRDRQRAAAPRADARRAHGPATTSTSPARSATRPSGLQALQARGGRPAGRPDRRRARTSVPSRACARGCCSAATAPRRAAWTSATASPTACGRSPQPRTSASPSTPLPCRSATARGAGTSGLAGSDRDRAHRRRRLRAAVHRAPGAARAGFAACVRQLGDLPITRIGVVTKEREVRCATRTACASCRRLRALRASSRSSPHGRGR